MGYYKAKSKKKRSKNNRGIKNFLLEEWNSIPVQIIQNLCKGYLDKIKKCFELGGERLEPEYFKYENKLPYNWIKSEIKINQRIVYNYIALKLCQKREIKMLKKEIKEDSKSCHPQFCQKI